MRKLCAAGEFKGWIFGFVCASEVARRPLNLVTLRSRPAKIITQRRPLWNVIAPAAMHLHCSYLRYQNVFLVLLRWWSGPASLYLGSRWPHGLASSGDLKIGTDFPFLSLVISMAISTKVRSALALGSKRSAAEINYDQADIRIH